MVIIDYFRALVFDWRKKKAIKTAQYMADLHRRKFLVLVWHGRPRVLSMQQVKGMIATKRLRGLTAEKARKIALYEANPTKNARPCS